MCLSLSFFFLFEGKLLEPLTYDVHITRLCHRCPASSALGCAGTEAWESTRSVPEMGRPQCSVVDA